MAGRSISKKVLRRDPGSFWKGTLVEPHQQLADGGVGLGQGEELAVAEGGQDPALGQQDSCLDLGLVLGLAAAGRQDDAAVVPRQLRGRSD